MNGRRQIAAVCIRLLLRVSIRRLWRVAGGITEAQQLQNRAAVCELGVARVNVRMHAADERLMQSAIDADRRDDAASRADRRIERVTLMPIDERARLCSSGDDAARNSQIWRRCDKERFLVS